LWNCLSCTSHKLLLFQPTATSLLWYCLWCTAHKLLLSWTKLINVSQSIMIYVIIGRKKQTELNSTDLRPTSFVIGRQGRLYWDQARVFQLVWKDQASSADVCRRPYRPMSAPLWPRPKAWVCCHSLNMIVGSNPTGDMDVCLL
jgi:hypothetical protein